METLTIAAYEQILRQAYQAFNTRDIDGALLHMDQGVDWPNGMEGGIEHGHEAVRKYWTRQWSMINPTVVPVAFGPTDGGRIDVTVRQVVKDLSGNVLIDETVNHLYTFNGNKIIAMEIRKSEQ